jgi:hypothetical protein
MSNAIKQNVDTHSTEFEEGVEAGLNSEKDTKNWKAGNALGQALTEDGENKKPIQVNPVNESSTPVFMSDNRDGQMGNAQDEKDETPE